MNWVVLTAAYPSPAEPERAIFIENLNRALLEVGGGDLAISVVAPRVHQADPMREVRHGVEVIRFRYPSRGRRLKEEPRVPLVRLSAYLLSGFWTTLRELNRTSGDLLVGHWVLPTGLIAAAVSRVLRLPAVLFAHGSDLNRYARQSGLARRLARWSLARAVRTFSVSRELSRILEDEQGVEPDRITHRPMGVAEDFSPGDRECERRALGLGPGPELLFVGDLTGDKGIRELLEALDELARRGLAVRLQVAGEGPLARELEQRAARPGDVPRVRRLGSLPASELARWYRGVDLLVLPSRAEGTPLVVMEALSSGLPVVASRVGGIPDLVDDGRTGLLVPPGDSRALARALEEVLADPERLARLRRRILETEPDFSVRRGARELFPLLMEAARAG